MPLRNLRDTLEQLSGAPLFTTLYLCAGYHQVEVSEEASEETAFSTHWGHYQRNRLPFGLCNAQGTFQRLTYCVLRGPTGAQCYVYLDDLIIFNSINVNERIERVMYLIV